MIKDMQKLSKDLILIDKPKGITSFDVIRALRKRLNIRKMGHAGTLDPLASGLLIIGVDKGTKKMHELLGLPKVYEVEILLGKKTETGDMEGKIIKEMKVDLSHEEFSEKNLKEVLKGLEGEVELPVPIYSAIKVKGKPLYSRARKGEKVVPPIKMMNIKKIEFFEIRKEGEHAIVKLSMRVGSGVYVRSVAEEIGRRLGVPATVYELRRISIGEFSVADASKIEDF